MAITLENIMKADPLSFHREALFEAVLNTVSDAITVIDKDLEGPLPKRGRPEALRSQGRRDVL
ncbi:MAG: hypothetical protein MZW92_61545 [Comamonadaceae bacterium]|nr:hypothetical protein [Comamonadaceae bacterium]